MRVWWLHIAAALRAAATVFAISCTAFTLIVAARQSVGRRAPAVSAILTCPNFCGGAGCQSGGSAAAGRKGRQDGNDRTGLPAAAVAVAGKGR